MLFKSTIKVNEMNSATMFCHNLTLQEKNIMWTYQITLKLPTQNAVYWLDANLITKNMMELYTFQVPSLEVAFLAKSCRPFCVRHSSGSRELSKCDRQCNLAWTSINTTGDNLHCCWWHDNDASPHVYACRRWCFSSCLCMSLNCFINTSHAARERLQFFETEWT